MMILALFGNFVLALFIESALRRLKKKGMWTYH